MTHPLQSKAWEEFRNAWGNETVRIYGSLITLHKVPLLNKKVGILEKGSTPTKEMLKKLKEYGEKNNLIFIKLEPNVLKDEKITNLLKSNGAVSGKTLFTPTTFQIDLIKTEDELMKSFSSKTRYNIRLAERKGVEVTEDNSDEAFEEYLELMRETVERDKFFAHNQEYHRLMWKSLKGKIAHLMVAKYDEEIVVAWILFASDGVLYYPYGASTQKYKNVMAPNLMMWEAIKFGRKNKLKVFDLWGREEGKGFTKFKEGYNPKVVEFLGTWDLVVNKPMYYLYRLMEFVRWQILRFKSNFTNPSF